MAYGFELIVSYLAVLAIVYGGIADLTQFRLPNWVSYGLVGLFVPFAALRWGQLPVRDHVVVGVTVFVLFFIFWRLRWVAGGDVKFVSALSLWVGPFHILKFVILLAIMSTVVALVLRASRLWLPYLQTMPLPEFVKRILQQAEQSKLPYGVPAAVAALIVLVPVLLLPKSILPQI